MTPEKLPDFALVIMEMICMRCSRELVFFYFGNMRNFGGVCAVQIAFAFSRRRHYHACLPRHQRYSLSVPTSCLQRGDVFRRGPDNGSRLREGMGTPYSLVGFFVGGSLGLNTGMDCNHVAHLQYDGTEDLVSEALGLGMESAPMVQFWPKGANASSSSTQV